MPKHRQSTLPGRCHGEGSRLTYPTGNLCLHWQRTHLEIQPPPQWHGLSKTNGSLRPAQDCEFAGWSSYRPDLTNHNVGIPSGRKPKKPKIVRTLEGLCPLWGRAANLSISASPAYCRFQSVSHHLSSERTSLPPRAALTHWCDLTSKTPQSACLTYKA